MKRKIFSILFALVLVLSFSLVTAVPVAANTDRLVPSQYATIQLAIDAASPGDTIIVAAGTYSGFTVPDTKANITILGARADVDPVGSTDRGGESIITGTVIIKADGVILNGFKMTASYVAVGYNHAHNVNISYNILENVTATWGAIHLHGTASGPSYHEADGGYIGYNTISGAAGHGIWTVGNDNVVIEYNHVLDVTGTAIDCLNHVGTGIVIRNNTITDPGQKGINYWAEAGAVISNNVISGTGWEAICTDIAATITGNEISSVNVQGIRLFDGAGGSTVSGNTISNAFYEGIQAFAQATITGNEISGCYHGIQIRKYATGTVIDSNNIHDNTYHGLEIPNYGGSEPDVTAASITNNTFAGNGYTGIKVGGGAEGKDIAVHFNEFIGNGIFGVESVTTSSDVDAEYNWWGDCSGPGPVGPGSGDSVSANVLFDPWLGKALCELRDAIAALPVEDFNNQKAWEDQQQALLDKIDAVCGQFGDGAYRGALNKLQHDVIKKLEKWIVSPSNEPLIEMVNAEIQILNGFLQ